MFFQNLKYAFLAGFLGFSGISQAVDCGTPEACYRKGLSLCVSPDEDSGEITDIYNDELFSGAEKYFTEACRQKYPEACIAVGDHYGEQPGNGGMIRDFAKALPFYVQACELGSDDGCEKTIYLYRSAGEYCELDPKTGAYKMSEKCFTDAGKYLDDFCTRGRASACTALGSIYSSKYDYGAPEFLTAVVYFRKACDLKLASGCFDLADSYERLSERGKDYDFLRVYQKACDLKYDLACRRAGEIYLGGIGTPRDTAKGVEYLGRACGISDYEACDTLAGFYEKGADGIAKDAARSRKYRERARDLEQVFWDNCDGC